MAIHRSRSTVSSALSRKVRLPSLNSSSRGPLTAATDVSMFMSIGTCAHAWARAVAHLVVGEPNSVAAMTPELCCTGAHSARARKVRVCVCTRGQCVHARPVCAVGTRATFACFASSGAL